MSPSMMHVALLSSAHKVRRLGSPLLVNERKIRKPKCSTGVFETEHRRIRLCAK